MTGAEFRAWALATAGVFCLGAIGYRVLTIPPIPDLSVTIGKANATLDTINRPCGSGKPCGTLANVDKLLVKSGDIIVTTQRQVQQTNRIVNAAADSLTSTSQHLNAQIDALGSVLASVRAATDAVPGTLNAARDAIQSAQGDIHGVADQATGATADVRRFINQPALRGTLENVQTITGEAAGITADGHRVVDKLTRDYLTPVPWYLVPVKRFGEIWDVSAAVARHTP